MASLMFIAVLMLQQAPAGIPTQVEAVTVEASAKPAQSSATLSDRTIEDQLNDLLAKEPERVICLHKAPTGTRIRVPLCQTLRGWYDFEAARDTAAIRGDARGGQAPPYELVDLIKSRLHNPKTRAMAEVRAGTRLEAEAQARANEP